MFSYISSVFVLLLTMRYEINSLGVYILKFNNVQEDIYNQCDNINKPICQGLQYQKTKMPNSVGITNQEDSEKRMKDYYPLINIQCSHYFRFFLCTIYFPMCTDVFGGSKALLPCKQLCIYIQSRCEPYIQAFKLKWPVELNCTALPANSTMCIQPRSYEQDLNRTLDSKSIDELRKLYPYYNNLFNSYDSKLKHVENENPIKELGSKCLESHVLFPSGFDNKTKSVLNTCRPRCDINFWYSSSDKTLARMWYLIWTVLCLVSSFVAILTFVFDQKERFMYPERPIIFIVLCYGFVCIFNLFQFGLGRKRIVCQATHTDPQEVILMKEGFESPMCTLTFLGMYYFDMVAALWWLMLAISCYLASARKWSCEGLERISNVMHIVAWTIPAISTTIVLILHKIDADELLGSCYVGRQNSKANLFFILLPRMIYFLLGSVLLILSFRSLLILRKNMAHNKLNLIMDVLQNQQSLEKFIAKTGIFCGVYGVPMTCYIGCQMYYYMHIDQWNQVGMMNIGSECVNKHGLRWSDKSCLKNLPLPLIEIRLLEIFSTLVIGITSGMWMWCNKKTLVNLHKFLKAKLTCSYEEKRISNSLIPMKENHASCSITSQNVESSVSTNKFKFPQIGIPPKFNNDLSRFNQQILICNV